MLVNVHNYIEGPEMRGNAVNPIPNHNTIPQNFPEFPKKRTTLPGILRFSEMSYQEFLFCLTFPSEFPEFSVKWFAFPKFSNFRCWQASLRGARYRLSQ